MTEQLPMSRKLNTCFLIQEKYKTLRKHKPSQRLNNLIYK